MKLNIVLRLKSLFRRIIHYRSLAIKKRLNHFASKILPRLICVDVGASYYPHPPWELFRRSKSTSWVAVEPNSENTSYIENWSWPSSSHIESIGLSESGGGQSLYVTNVDSGSSLLPPEISKNMEHRVYNKEYFFPLTIKHIETKSLSEILKDYTTNSEPIILKLDTQGTELSILKGAQQLFDDHRIVGIETEATLLAEPIMNGSGKLWQICQFLESQGFELLQLKPIEASPRKSKSSLIGRGFLNECDAVFCLKHEEVLNKPASYALALFGFYICYDLYEEARALFDKVTDIDQLCAQSEVSSKEIRKVLSF